LRGDDRANSALATSKDTGFRVKHSALRRIPSVEKLAQALGEIELPRPVVLDVVRRELAALRTQKSIPAFDIVLARVRAAVRDLGNSRLRPVINGTGILIHTNFGRAPLAPEAIERLVQISANYNNLEYDLSGAERGGRAAYLERCLASLCGAEAATVVNNNAAALILTLRHFCEAALPAEKRRRPSHRAQPVVQMNEVIISRGELIQIGGGFRIPDILESSGARLREVGTTNQTTLGDYARAIGRSTALILKVHRSNFFMGGFVDSPSTEEIAALARKKRVAFAEDLGSGAAINTEEVAGLEHEPMPMEAIRRGVDLVCFSGDKLLGGPQAGVIAGKAKLVAAIKRDPFFRALRCSKLILSGLEATVESYLREGDEIRGAGIPVLGMLRTPHEELRARAGKIVSELAELPIRVTAGQGRAQIGGGSMPTSAIDSVTIDLTPGDLASGAIGVQEIAARLRRHATPVIGYISRGKLKLDLRTIFPRQDAEVVSAIRAAVVEPERP
jgi:L-seryl-tRNA(Ser) seleniumtransferase